MKKLIAILFMLIMLAGCMGITTKTSFFGDFVDDIPPGLYDIHCKVLDHMIPIKGTKLWEYTVLPNGDIAGHIDQDGFRGWCSNYAIAIKKKLLKAGYDPDQIKYVHCSIYDPEKPDHVVVFLTLQKDQVWVFDAAKNFVMKPDEYSTKLTIEGIQSGNLPYIWWAKAEDKWIPTKF